MISPIVTRGFGSFGSVNLVVTRGFGIGAPSSIVAGPYYFVTAAMYAAGASVGLIYAAGASAGQLSTE